MNTQNGIYSIHHVCNDWSLELHRAGLTREQVEAELQEMGGVKLKHYAEHSLVKDQHGDTFLQITPAFV